MRTHLRRPCVTFSKYCICESSLINPCRCYITPGYDSNDALHTATQIFNRPAPTEIYDSLTERLVLKAELNIATMECGEQFVMTFGTTLMPVLSAGN